MKKMRLIVAKHLKEARGKLTQTFVAKTLGLSQAVLSKIESGSREPTAMELKQFADLYKKPVTYFFEPAMISISDKLRIFFKKHARSLNIAIAFLYGSFARGIPNAKSDIDIAILFDPECLADEKAFEIISDLSVSLEKQFGRESNIIVIRPEKWKPMLYYNVIVLGEPIFIRSEDKYRSVRWEAIRQMEDFAAMGIGWQIAAARAGLRRLEHG